MLHGTVSRPFPLGKIGGLDATLTPTLQGAALRNYFGVSGVTQITPGISLKLEKPTKNGTFFLEAFGKHQFGNEKKGMEVHTYWGVGGGWAF